jgi:hypothetical protein
MKTNIIESWDYTLFDIIWCTWFSINIFYFMIGFLCTSKCDNDDLSKKKKKCDNDALI